LSRAEGKGQRAKVTLQFEVRSRRAGAYAVTEPLTFDVKVRPSAKSLQMDE